MKQLETPEEKRARRLAKKEAKERKRKEQMGWDKDYLVNTWKAHKFASSDRDEQWYIEVHWKKHHFSFLKAGTNIVLRAKVVF